jgi:YfiH family protein
VIIRSEILLNVSTVTHGFCDRHGGRSVGHYKSLNIGVNRGDYIEMVLKNREIIAKMFGVPAPYIVSLHQRHGDTVQIVHAGNIESYRLMFLDNHVQSCGSGDAIITNLSGVLIGVQTADCAPILLCDEKVRFVSAIHAGWRGTVGNVIENTVSTLTKLGCKNICAAIGPCIQKQSFEVGDEIISVVDKNYISEIDDKKYFDMPMMIHDKLVALGIKKIESIGIDTVSDENFFSHRRQNGQCGVQFSGILLKKVYS